MLSVAGSIALITSVLLGGDVGVYGCRASLFAAILAGTAAGLILPFLTIGYQRDRWRKAPQARRELEQPSHRQRKNTRRPYCRKGTFWHVMAHMGRVSE
jgi:hypothetical protein